MREFCTRTIRTGLLLSFALPALGHAQPDPTKIFKTNCVLCHSADGSGDSATGKALHAKDLRSNEVQKMSDEDLADAITKGKGKMPAFGSKVHPDDVKKLVAYIRELPKK